MNISNLTDLQDKLDEEKEKYIKKDFQLKVTHDKRIKTLLERRDKIIRDSPRELQLAFYETISENFEELKNYFPVKKDQKLDFSFLKTFKVEYLENSKMRVVLELFENEYVKNGVLIKIYDFFTEKVEVSKINWQETNPRNCNLFKFFEDLEPDFQAFDVFYEFYVDQLSFTPLKKKNK
jgi:hypothetical protein